MSSVFSVPDAELLHEVMDNYVKIPSAESRNEKLLGYVNNNFNKVFHTETDIYINNIPKQYPLGYLYTEHIKDKLIIISSAKDVCGHQ